MDKKIYPSFNFVCKKYTGTRIIYAGLFLVSIALFAAGCKKSSSTSTAPVLPTVVTTPTIINVTSTAAQSGGVITDIGNAAITANGVCWSSTDQTPTTSDTKTTDSVVTNALSYPPFTSLLKNLTPNTTYYLRAYATNVAGTGYGSVLKFTTSASLTAVNTTVITFAGNGSAGYVDGTGTGAQFNNPSGVSVDGQGNVYVSDTYNTIIREITPGGVVSTFAGIPTIGYADGTASTAQFYAPHGSAVDAAGNLYVADYGNNVIRKITPAGIVSTYAGTAGVAGYRNGAATAANLTGSSDTLAYFNNPAAVAVDAGGNVYVADRGNNVIRKILTTGRVITIAGTRTAGYVDATDETASFNKPSGIAVDNSGNVYVADQGNSAIRKITSTDVVTTLAGGTTQPSLLNYPTGIAIDSQGNLYIVDETGRVFQYTTNNVLYQIAGTANLYGFVNGAGSVSQFNSPQSIAIDANNNIYVADQNNNAIRKITITLTN